MPWRGNCSHLHDKQKFSAMEYFNPSEWIQQPETGFSPGNCRYRPTQNKQHGFAVHSCIIRSTRDKTLNQWCNC